MANRPYMSLPFGVPSIVTFWQPNAIPQNRTPNCQRLRKAHNKAFDLNQWPNWFSSNPFSPQGGEVLSLLGMNPILLVSFFVMHQMYSMYVYIYIRNFFGVYPDLFNAT